MPGVRVALIVNPASRSVDPAAVEAELAAEGAEVERFELNDVARATTSGAERIALASGDGSIGPVAAAAGQAGLPLALIPGGTANDFARRIGLPRDLRDSCRLAVSGGRLQGFELGTMTPRHGEDEPAVARPFVNVASLGLPAPAAARARSWKSALGPLAYGLGAVHAGLTAGPVRCRAVCDGTPLHQGPAWQLTVACSGAFGAGSRLEEADPADGLLDVVAVAAGSRLRLISLAYGIRRGTLVGRTGVHHVRGRRVEVEARAGATFNVDGELVQANAATFDVQRDAFRLVAG
jgi:diacylglycerol kinase (ATP)